MLYWAFEDLKPPLSGVDVDNFMSRNSSAPTTVSIHLSKSCSVVNLFSPYATLPQSDCKGIGNYIMTSPLIKNIAICSRLTLDTVSPTATAMLKSP